MAGNTHEDKLERAKRNGPKIASHPAWELNELGTARPKRAYRLLHIALFLPLVVELFLRDQVLLIYGGYGEYQFFMKLIAAAVTIAAVWFASAMWKSDANLLGVTFLIAMYALFAYWLILSLAYSTVPKIATRVMVERIVIETDLYAVQSDRGNPRGGWARDIMGRNQRYCYQIPGQPTLVSFKSDNHLGQYVHGIGSRFINPTPIYFSGRGNWFGLRVDAVSLSSPVPRSEILSVRPGADFDGSNDLPRSC